METKNISQSVSFPCTASELYTAWMDSKMHGKMVEGTAKIDPKIGGKFSIWDDSITGKTL